MKFNSIEINWESLGAKLANLSSSEQNKFFIGFSNEMRTYESTYATENQLHAVREGRGQNELPFSEEQKKIYQILGGEDE